MGALALLPNPRILSLACGSSIDVARAVKVIPNKSSVVCLNDTDEDALSLSKSRISKDSVGTVEVLPGNALRVARRLVSNGRQFDLVLAGGLFDYLSNDQASYLLTQCYSLLTDTGSVFFTNFRAPNIYSAWMRYVADWNLFERDEADIYSMIKLSNIDPSLASLQLDETGLTFLVTISKGVLVA
jgi:ubiquinone/menaquinone biosynthesis C-methylase UbiE